MKKIFYTLGLAALALGAKAQFSYEFYYDDSGNRAIREYIDLTVQEDPPGGELPGPLTETEGEGESELLADNDQTEPEAANERKNILNSEFAGRPIDIYPNPTEGRLLIAIADFEPEEKGEWMVVSVSGKILAHSDELAAEIPIDLSGEATGRYILKLRIGEAVKEWVVVKR